MALVDIGFTPVADPRKAINAPLSGTSYYRLDNANKAVAAILIAPKTGTIDRIGFDCNAVASPPTYRIGLETVSGKLPTGTYLNSGAAYVDDASIGAAFEWFDLSTNAPSVTVGDYFAATVRYSGTGTIGVSNYIEPIYASATNPYAHMPLTAYADATPTWTLNVSALHPMIVVRYSAGSGGTIISDCFGLESVTGTGWDSADEPLWRGNLWVPPYGCRLVGALVGIRTAASENEDFDLEVYRDSETSPLTGCDTSIDISEIWEYRSNTCDLAFIPVAPTILVQGSSYRFVVRPTTVNAFTSWYNGEFPDEACLLAVLGPLYYTTSNSGTPSWTTYNAASPGWRQGNVIPVIDQIDVAGSSGGGLPILGGSIAR